MPHTNCKPPGSSLYTCIFLRETGYSTCDAVSHITWDCEGLALSQPKRQSDRKLVGHVAIQVNGMWRSGGEALLHPGSKPPVFCLQAIQI